MRSKRHPLGDRWHLDEVYLSINGKLQYLWRAVDQDGEVLDILVQPRRTDRLPRSSFASCCGDCSMCRGPSSPTNSAVMPPPKRRYCPMCSTVKTSERTI